MIGIRIKSLRKENNLLQKDLADKLSLSQQSISLYEAKKREPDYETLKIIAKFFNVSTDYILGISNIKNPYKEKDFDEVDEFVAKLKKKADERGIDFDENSIDEILDLYEFIKKRDKK